jgi:ATP-dependent protease Clp ATPase subunit
MYEIPSRNDVKEVIITRECVTEKAEPKLILKPRKPKKQELLKTADASDDKIAE